MLLVLLQLRNKAVNSPHTRCFRIIGGACDYISTSSSTSTIIIERTARLRHRALSSSSFGVVEEEEMMRASCIIKAYRYDT